MRIFVLTGLILLFCMISFPEVSAQTVDDLILMTEEYPPNNFEENGKLTGISVDLMVRMLKKLNSGLTRKDICLLPWANAYNKLLKKKNTLLFGMSRIPARENLFKWVGPIISIKHVLMARKDRHIRIHTIEELKKYRTGVIRDDVGEILLLEKGIEKKTLERVPKAIILIKMLNAGKIDLWSYCETVAKWLLKKNGFDPGNYETIHILKEVHVYYAFHIHTSDSLIQKFQNALDELKIKPDGTQSEYEKVLGNYLK